MITLNIGVRDGVSPDTLRGILAKLDATAVEPLQPLFPDHPVQEMRTLYCVEISTPDHTRLIQQLRQHPDIVFAEQPPARHLVAPV